MRLSPWYSRKCYSEQSKSHLVSRITCSLLFPIFHQVGYWLFWMSTWVFGWSSYVLLFTVKWHKSGCNWIRLIFTHSMFNYHYFIGNTRLCGFLPFHSYWSDSWIWYFILIVNNLYKTVILPNWHLLASYNIERTLSYYRHI